MVRVVGLSQEEINERERRSKLVELTKKEVGIFRTTSTDSCIRIGLFRSSAYVFFMDNKIHVENPNYFDKAMELAKAYEDADLGDFTVKRNYSEEPEADNGAIDSSSYAT